MAGAQRRVDLVGVAALVSTLVPAAFGCTPRDSESPRAR